MKGLTLPQKIMWLLLISIAVAGILFAFYREGVISPPITPTNLEELADWNHSDIQRILNYYNCNTVPIYRMSSDVPANLREITEFCSIVSRHWAQAFREDQYGSALKGAKKLRERTKNNE